MTARGVRRPRRLSSRSRRASPPAGWPSRSSSRQTCASAADSGHPRPGPGRASSANALDYADEGGRLHIAAERAGGVGDADDGEHRVPPLRRRRGPRVRALLARATRREPTRARTAAWVSPIVRRGRSSRSAESAAASVAGDGVFTIRTCASAAASGEAMEPQSRRCSHWVLLVSVGRRDASACPGPARVRARFPVVGTVQDQTGGMLGRRRRDARRPGPDAGPGGQSRTPPGDFRIDDVGAGDVPSCASNTRGSSRRSRALKVGPRAPAPQKLVLQLAGLTQEVTVGDKPVSIDAAQNRNTITVDKKLLVRPAGLRPGSRRRAVALPRPRRRRQRRDDARRRRHGGPEDWRLGVCHQADQDRPGPVRRGVRAARAGPHRGDDGGGQRGVSRRVQRRRSATAG